MVDDLSSEEDQEDLQNRNPNDRAIQPAAQQDNMDGIQTSDNQNLFKPEETFSKFKIIHSKVMWEDDGRVVIDPNNHSY